MIQKEFKTLKDDELCRVQGGIMYSALYAFGNRQHASAENVFTTAGLMFRYYNMYSIMP